MSDRYLIWRGCRRISPGSPCRSAGPESAPGPPAGRREVLAALAAKRPAVRGRSSSAGIKDGELLECAWPEVTQIVDPVALEQRHDVAALGRAHRNAQQQVTVPQRLVVDRQGGLVVAELLKGSHDPAAQPVGAGMPVQDLPAP